MSASAFCESLTFKKVYQLFHFEFFCHSTEEQDYYSKARQKQRPYRHLTDTFHSPLRPIPTHFRHIKNILDNLKTTLRHLLDSFETIIRNLLIKSQTHFGYLKEIFLINSQTPSEYLQSILEALSRNFSDPLRTPSRHLVDTIQTPYNSLPDSFRTSYRHLPDNSLPPVRHIPDNLHTLTKAAVYITHRVLVGLVGGWLHATLWPSLKGLSSLQVKLTSKFRLSIAKIRYRVQ